MELCCVYLLPNPICAIFFVLLHLDNLRVVSMVLGCVVYRLHDILLAQRKVEQRHAVDVPDPLQSTTLRIFAPRLLPSPIPGVPKPHVVQSRQFSSDRDFSARAGAVRAVLQTEKRSHKGSH